jgi:biopolymer transport protein ExbB/TolQ
MARLLERAVRFTPPGRYIVNMLLFLTAAAAVGFYVSPWSPDPSTILIDAFNANRALNGLILGVLLIGIIYHLRQAGVVDPAIRWIDAFRESVDPRRARLPRPPALITAMARMLVAADGGGRLTPEVSRSMLDSIGTRMDEGREMGRYIGHLLVFLGLLGTFWGLIQTVNGVVATISGLAVTGGEAEDAIAQLINNLKAPLSGMGTAFSSSLFGLAGSLIVGFLDLQASQAQGRFYSDLEDWLASMTETRSAIREGASFADDAAAGDLPRAVAALERALAANADTQIKAHERQMAELRDEIRALNRSIIRSGGGD